jgi:hypothetical protein
VTHWLSFWQVAGQLAVVPRQRYGAQVGVPAPLTFVQVPSAVAPSEAAQTSHDPLQALSQQTLSAQWEDEHSWSPPQLVPPTSLGTQWWEPSQ